MKASLTHLSLGMEFEICLNPIYNVSGVHPSPNSDDSLCSWTSSITDYATSLAARAAEGCPDCFFYLVSTLSFLNFSNEKLLFRWLGDNQCSLGNIHLEYNARWQRKKKANLVIQAWIWILVFQPLSLLVPSFIIIWSTCSVSDHVWSTKDTGKGF